ncbi:MAG: restriction endonuclease subunit S, partial [Acidobacteriota bacterium]
MEVEAIPFSELLSEVVDNRGRTCPTADEGIPLIATNCIRNELLYPTYEKARFISRDTYSSWFRGHPKPGDILFVNKATPGRVCLVPDPVDFCIAQDMVAVRANVKKVYPKYLFAALRSPIVQEQIAHMHVGTLIPHFRKGDFDKLLIPVPSPDQQQFIGDFYFNLSAKIDVNRGMNETLEAMARALFTSWFVNFDPVRAKAADLIRNRILEVGDGYRAKNSELGETGLPFIRAGNLNDGFDTDGAALLREESVAKAGSKLSCTGDVAFTSKGTIGRFARVTQHTQQFVYSPQVCYWRS